MKRIEDYVISIPDFPEPGIIFRDITGILRDADGLKLSIDKIQEMLEGVEFDAVLGLESRGFIFGMPIAYNLHKAFIPVRKKGKLPRETVSAKYDLEYGTAEIEIHKEDLRPGMKVVIIDCNRRNSRGGCKVSREPWCRSCKDCICHGAGWIKGKRAPGRL